MSGKIIQIDAEKCVGCGACAAACHQGAIQMIDGKAKLVDENHCDGLGRCLPQCPVDAIRLIDRPAQTQAKEGCHCSSQTEIAVQPKYPPPLKCGCPGKMVQTFEGQKMDASSAQEIPSALRQWPVQLQLVPINAPYWKEADLLIAADCTAFSYGGFHPDFLNGKRLIIACPKLDDTNDYVEKLSEIFAQNDIRSLEVLYMEVPCCHSLVTIVKGALKKSKKDIPVKYTELSLQGEIKN